MRLSGTTRVAGVAGWPVAHSLSPRLHNAWLTAAGIDGVYVPMPTAAETAADAFRALAKLGFVGANVTLPLKEIALASADIVSARAKAMGAANVLVVKDGVLSADNTDVDGVQYALRHTPVMADRPALVWGAGGAARAIVYAVIDLGWRAIRLTNRNRGRAERLADAARSFGSRLSIEVFDWDDRQSAMGNAGLMVNATSLGMGDNPPLPVDLASAPDDATVFDSVYTPLVTPLLRDAQARGLGAQDGLDMLIGQAIPSFEAFFGQPPPADLDARSLLLEALGA